MRRLLLAAGLALALHGLLLSLRGDWIMRKPVQLPRPDPISIALSYRYPEIKPELVPKNPEKPKVRPVTPPPKKPRKRIKKQTKKEIAPPKKETHTPITPVDTPKTEDSPAEEPVRETAETSPAAVSKGEPVREEIETGPVAVKKEEAIEDAVEAGQGEPEPPAPPSLKEAVPVYRVNPAPEYPKMARRRGYEGTVLLEVLVNRNGKVEDLRLSRSSGHLILDRAAMDSVRNWLFEPAKRGDQEVDMWVEVPVRFELK